MRFLVLCSYPVLLSRQTSGVPCGICVPQPAADRRYSPVSLGPPEGPTPSVSNPPSHFSKLLYQPLALFLSTRLQVLFLFFFIPFAYKHVVILKKPTVDPLSSPLSSREYLFMCSLCTLLLGGSIVEWNSSSIANCVNLDKLSFPLCKMGVMILHISFMVLWKVHSMWRDIRRYVSILETAAQ